MQVENTMTSCSIKPEFVVDLWCLASSFGATTFPCCSFLPIGLVGRDVTTWARVSCRRAADTWGVFLLEEERFFSHYEKLAFDSTKVYHIFSARDVCVLVMNRTGVGRFGCHPLVRRHDNVFGVSKTTRRIANAIKLQGTLWPGMTLSTANCWAHEIFRLSAVKILAGDEPHKKKTTDTRRTNAILSAVALIPERGF